MGLLTTRRVTRLPFNNVFVTKHYAEYKVASHDRNTIVFPLWVQSDPDSGVPSLFENKRRLNLNPAFLRGLAYALSVSQEPQYGLPRGFIPDNIFYYAYAIFHSPAYRSRYAEFLKIDFPRLPLPSSQEVFRKLDRLGGELVTFHLIEARSQQSITARYDKATRAWLYEIPKDEKLPITVSFNGPETPVVENVAWSNDTVWIDAIKRHKGARDTTAEGEVGFLGVPEEVWKLQIGGYQVCKKWLKDRKGRILTAEDIAHYHRIIIALHETVRIMPEIDEVIDAHGGWPAAFRTG